MKLLSDPSDSRCHTVQRCLKMNEVGVKVAVNHELKYLSLNVLCGKADRHSD